ncbi:hypothetical protein [Bradyrhizobium pachyrhizi]|uniref:hypothetical protein n=1 Tax=Bradyrhizobium pachyrhizi TaxID=280333 RepID=UPI000A65D423|nr:hypothetical protein [Bradyrhizobium pachyrhizi]
MSVATTKTITATDTLGEKLGKRDKAKAQRNCPPTHSASGVIGFALPARIPALA